MPPLRLTSLTGESNLPGMRGFNHSRRERRGNNRQRWVRPVSRSARRGPGLTSIRSRCASQPGRCESNPRGSESIFSRFASISPRSESIPQRSESIFWSFESIARRFASIFSRCESISPRLESIFWRCKSIFWNLESISRRFASIRRRCTHGRGCAEVAGHLRRMRGRAPPDAPVPARLSPITSHQMRKGRIQC
jgi:hypothetical protein